MKKGVTDLETLAKVEGSCHNWRNNPQGACLPTNSNI